MNAMSNAVVRAAMARRVSRIGREGVVRECADTIAALQLNSTEIETLLRDIAREVRERGE